MACHLKAKICSPESAWDFVAFLGSEKYNVIKAALVDILPIMQRLANSGFVYVEGEKVNIQFVFCSDKKMVLLILGKTNQCGHFFCGLCDATQAQMYEFSFAGLRETKYPFRLLEKYPIVPFDACAMQKSSCVPSHCAQETF